MTMLGYRATYETRAPGWQADALLRGTALPKLLLFFPRDILEGCMLQSSQGLGFRSLRNHHHDECNRLIATVYDLNNPHTGPSSLPRN